MVRRMRPSRSVFVLVLGMTTGCAKCAGIEEEPRATPQEVQKQGRQRFKVLRPEVLARLDGGAAPAPSGAASGDGSAP